MEERVGNAQGIDFGEIMERSVRAAEELSAARVYAGFSLGVMPAQRLAQTRAGTRRAVLLHACLPVSEFGASWPEGVPVHIHGKEAEPYFADESDLEAARELVAGSADAELFLYPGEQHPFAGSSSALFDAEVMALLTQRVVVSLVRTNESTAP